MDETIEIARRIEGIRDASGYTQEQMAKELNIDIETYKEYEKNGHNIPISVIFHIANKFNVDLSEILTGTSAKLDTYHVVKAGNGKEVDRYPGYNYTDLAFRYTKKIMQPLLVTLDPSDKPAALVSHSGQEFNYVLKGKMAFIFDSHQIILNEGDCIYFNPSHSHGQKCASDIPVVFLTVIAE
ncbi:MAG: Cupin domain protein [Firmicutes bacterium ADurb.Bin146]|nr:MAG: Cupin domain protein [Firmicutes bacterium ADurb.Bin146]